MNSNKHNSNKILLAIGLCGLGLWAGAAAAHGYQDQGDAQARKLDRAGDRAEAYYDRKGDRIEHKLDHRADHLRDQGRYAEARRLERKGDRIDHRLDHKGERINHQLDRKADRLRDHHGHDHRYGYSSGYEVRPYYYRPRAVAVAPYPAYPVYREPGVTLAIDLGTWLIRP